MEEEKKIEEIKSGETKSERGPVDKAVEESVTELVDGNKEEEVADTQSAREGESGKEAPTETKAVDERAEKPMFTQSQVDELVGKARQEGRQKGYESAMTELRERYGVDGDDDLDRIFANGGRFDELSSRYEKSGKELAEVRAELALARSGIVPERQSDARAILAGNGMDVSEETLPRSYRHIQSGWERRRKLSLSQRCRTRKSRSRSLWLSESNRSRQTMTRT